MENSTVFKISDGVRTREEDFGLLIVSKNTPALSLNFDGKVIWELIDGQNSVEKIIEIVSQEYEQNSVKTKTYELLEGFEKLKLIEKC